LNFLLEFSLCILSEFIANNLGGEAKHLLKAVFVAKFEEKSNLWCKVFIDVITLHFSVMF